MDQMKQPQTLTINETGEQLEIVGVNSSRQPDTLIYTVRPIPPKEKSLSLEDEGVHCA